ncbi:MAG: hypothetical protein ABJZ54_04505 [Luteolibacter sp.]
MKMKRDDDWAENDATWKLLGEAAPKEASPRFADDTLRAVRLLPEADPWWPKILRFSPWVAAAACGAFAVMFYVDGPDTGGKSPVVEAPVEVSPAEEWVQIEEAATAELLAAAADHPEDFSDQELVALIGF